MDELEQSFARDVIWHEPEATFTPANEWAGRRSEMSCLRSSCSLAVIDGEDIVGPLAVSTRHGIRAPGDWSNYANEAEVDAF